MYDDPIKHAALRILKTLYQRYKHTPNVFKISIITLIVRSYDLHNFQIKTTLLLDKTDEMSLLHVVYV